VRFPTLSDAAQLLNVWSRMILQYEKDYEALKPKLGTVTLTASVASTTLANAALRPTSKLVFTPRTAHAAAELATMYVDAPTQGAVVIHHANNVQTDRTFQFVVLGT
jgi:hypothetical protein